MRILARLRPRRLAGHAAIALIVATATAAGVAFANSGGGNPTHKTPAANAGGQARMAMSSGIRSALERLVATGTIDQSQARAVERQAATGSIDPAALVAAGTVNKVQMRAIAGALDQVKRSLAAAGGDRAAGGKVAGANDGARAPAVIQRASRTALQRLVADGTIDQAQADTIQRDVASGRVDSHALIAAGTVNQAQMEAVMQALANVKQAAAASHP